MVQRPQYTFYIKDGEAIAEPTRGGCIESFSSDSPAVQVQGQGNFVVVTYASGQVVKYPWPTDGGVIEELAPRRATPRDEASAPSASLHWFIGLAISIPLIICWGITATALFSGDVLAFGLFGGAAMSIYIAFNLHKSARLAGLGALVVLAAFFV